MTDVIELLTLLNNIFGNHRAQGRNEYLFFCPFCSHHKPKLAINVETGRWHCWVCETRGRSLISLLKKVNAPQSRIKQLRSLLHEDIQFEETEESTKALVLPFEFKPLWNTTKDYEARHAMVYLKSRGVTMTDIIKHNIGYCSDGEYANRIIIPSYDKEGQLNFFTARAYRDIKPPYRNPIGSKNIVGFESLISWKFDILICEGPLDAIAARRNAIPLFGKTLSQELRNKIILNRPPGVYLMLDRDAVLNAVKIAQDLVKQDMKVYIVQLDEKDPSSAGFQNIWSAIKSTEEVTLNDLVKLRLFSNDNLCNKT